jgi:hypothetical protein
MNDTYTVPDENNLQPLPAVLRMTIGITRKATGLTETYELVSDPVTVEEATQLGAQPEQPKEA